MVHSLKGKQKSKAHDNVNQINLKKQPRTIKKKGIEYHEGMETPVANKNDGKKKKEKIKNKSSKEYAVIISGLQDDMKDQQCK